METNKVNTYKDGLQENVAGEVSPEYGATSEDVGTVSSSGSEDKPARGDHVHAHGNQTDEDLHAKATDTTDGFMSAEDKDKLDGIDDNADDSSAHISDLDIHREMDDAAASTIKLYSSQKIEDRLGEIVQGRVRMPNVDTCTTDLGNITLSGEQTLNGLLTNVSDVIVTEQSDASKNGVYVSAVGAWTRRDTEDDPAELSNGNIWSINNQGSTHHGHEYRLLTQAPIVIDTTDLDFEETPDPVFGASAGTFTEGDDSRLPTQDENDALAGEGGTPSAANKVILNDDARLVALTGAQIKTLYEVESLAYNDDKDVVFSQLASTGWKGIPPIFTVNGGDPDLFDMSSGVLELIDHSTDPSTITLVAVNAVVGEVPSLLASEQATFYSVDVTGNLVGRVERLTPTQRRSEATVGVVSHINNVNIDVVSNTPQVTISAVNQLYDLIRAIGFFSTTGNLVSGAPGTMTINKSLGAGFALHGNAFINVADPHNFPMAAQTPATMNHITQTLVIDHVGSAIDPDIWDDGGVVTAVSGDATIGRIYIFPNNTMTFMLGQEEFGSFSIAKDFAGNESFILPLDIDKGGLLLARVVLKKGASDITDPSEAQIIPAAGIAGGAAALTSMQQGYDISSEPEYLLDLIRGAITIRSFVGGSGENSIEFLNDLGELAAAINGLGQLGLRYNTGPMAAGDFDFAQVINIDESGATGGFIAALAVLATEGLAEVAAIDVGPNVGPIRQQSGDFLDMDSALVNAVDSRTAFITAGNDVQIFVANSDTVTIGHATKFEGMEFLLAIVSSGGGIAPTFEYSTGVGTWATFEVVDGTNGMRNSGNISWQSSNITGWLVGTGSEFLIRITRTRNSLSVVPTESKVQIAQVVGYSWDKDGNLVVNNIIVQGQAHSPTQILIDAANIAVDFNAGQVGKVIITANRNLLAPTNMEDGATYIIQVQQNATGGWSITFDSVYDFGEDGIPTISQAPNKRTNLYCVSNGTTIDVTVARGFN
ncbi:MAG: hypothetical protein V3T43_02815 [Nitrosomonadaceae bacterium]